MFGIQGGKLNVSFFILAEKAEAYEPESFADDDSALDVFNKVER